MRSLLDVNVLIALHDPQHVHHHAALQWLEADGGDGWASCPITQNGWLRVMNQPSYSNPVALADLLRTAGSIFASPTHEFWPDDISVLDGKRLRPDRVLGHRQLTDIYLLALAVRHQGRLVTLDLKIPVAAVVGASARHLVVI
jgi:uncharacterized protein